jgi:hypothetical protein
VGTCNQIALLILYYISSRLLSLLKVFDAPMQVSDICNLVVSFKCITCSSQVFILLILKCLLFLCLTLFRLSTLLQFGSYNHGILVSVKLEYWYFCHAVCCDMFYWVYLHQAVSHYICILFPRKPNHCYLHCLLPVALFCCAVPCHICPTPQHTTPSYSTPLFLKLVFMAPPTLCRHCYV